MNPKQRASDMGEDYAVSDWDSFTQKRIYTETVVPELIDISDDMKQVPQLVEQFKDSALQ